MTRDDVERIIENAFRELEIRVLSGGSFDPNTRTVVLEYQGVEISRASFDVVDSEEYNG